MEHKIDQIVRQVSMHKNQLHELEAALHRQADTANRRYDALYRTVGQGFQAVNHRLDQHEIVFEAIDNRLNDNDDPLAAVV